MIIKDLRSIVITLQLRMIERSGVKSDGRDKDPIENLASEELLFEFMRLAGEPITWIESKELWNDMRSTNNGNLPKFSDALLNTSMRSMMSLGISASVHSTGHFSDDETGHGGNNGTSNNIAHEGFKRLVEDIKELSEEDIATFSQSLACDIKQQYSIRLTTDWSELKFVLGSLCLLWSAVLGVSLAGHYYPENKKIGTFSPAIFVESFSLFAVELIWECILSWVVLKYNIKINYTRKLGNLIKVPKYFVGGKICELESQLSVTNLFL